MRAKPATIGIAVLLQGACTGHHGDTYAESGWNEDSGQPQECGLIAPPAHPGCLVLMYDDLKGYGRRPDEHRMLYDEQARLQSYDYRSAMTSEDFMVCAYDWTESGNPLTEWCTGQSVYTYRWDYDSNGYPAAKYYDGASDGAVDRTWDYEVDADGNVVEEALDQDADGAYDSYIWYTFNEDGTLASDSWDYHGDGIADYERTYSYNSEGLLADVITDSDADGIQDASLTYSYDDYGNVLTIAEDEGVDGQWDLLTEHSYADCLLTGIVERELSGVSNSVAYTYDDQGRLFREDYDWDDDGGRDAFAAWEYTCP